MNLVTVEDLKSALENKSKGTQFVDVRTEGEFQRSRIEDFVNIPMGSPAEKWAALDKSAPTYVLCLSGSRSLQASGELEAMDFKDVRNVQGGMLTWRGKGFPVVS